jgi:hypothetical protein
MSKSILFFILIFSNVAMASGYKMPQPSNLLDHMIQDYVTHVPLHVRQMQASNRSPSMFSAPSAGLIGFGISILGCIVETVGNSLASSPAARQQTTVQQLSQLSKQEATTNKEAVNQEEQEALDAIKSLSIDQIKMLAEAEEREGNDSHYFRDRYAAMLKLPKQ